MRRTKATASPQTILLTYILLALFWGAALALAVYLRYLIP